MSLDYWIPRISFHFPNESVFKWGGSSLVPKGRFILYLRAQLVYKGCLYNLVHVKDSRSKGPSLQTVPMVYEFLEMFPDDLMGVSLNREIVLGLIFFWILILFLSFLIEWLWLSLKNSRII